MKKIVVSFLLLGLGCCLNADESPLLNKITKTCLPTYEAKDVANEFLYVDLGVRSIYYPTIEIGGRVQRGHYGLDTRFGVHISRFRDVFFSGSLGMNYYFNPFLASQLYVGTGFLIKCSSFYQDVNIALDPYFAFGKEFQNASKKIQFWELRVGIPVGGDSKMATFPWCNIAVSYPLISFCYGFAF